MKLSGWKTYLCFGGGLLATAAMFLGWIDESMWLKAVTVLGLGGGMALRAGIKKVE